MQLGMRPKRLSVWRRVLLRPVVAGAVAVIAVISNLEWLRDHLLPATVRDRLQLNAALPQFTWQTWIALTAVAIVVLTLEWTFRELRDSSDAVATTVKQLKERVTALESPRPRLVLGYDMDYPPGYDPTMPTFSWFSPFYIRNDGDETAYNVQVETAGHFKGFAFSPLNNYPPDGQRHRMHLRHNGEKVSFGLEGALLKDKDFLDEIVRRVRESAIENEDLALNVLLKYDSVTGLRFYDRFDIIYPCTRMPDGRVQLGRMVIRFLHPLAGAPDASSARA